MNYPQKKMEKLRNFLLGNIIDEVERQKIELRIILDDDYFQELLIEEDELIQDYVDELLSENERLIFERNFRFTKERALKLRLARALRYYINQHAEK